MQDSLSMQTLGLELLPSYLESPYLSTDFDTLTQASLLARSAATQTGVLTDEQTLSLMDELLDVQTNSLTDDNKATSVDKTLDDQAHLNSLTINVLDIVTVNPGRLMH